jgi:hypothetical protein
VTDFPRGWTRSVDVAGAPGPTITVAAIAGVAHVLDSFTAKLMDQGAGAATMILQATSSDGSINQVLGRLATPVPAAGSLETDSISGSELGLATGPGASLTVSFAGASNLTGTLVIQGHDI